MSQSLISMSSFEFHVVPPLAIHCSSFWGFSLSEEASHPKMPLDTQVSALLGMVDHAALVSLSPAVPALWTHGIPCLSCHLRYPYYGYSHILFRQSFGLFPCLIATMPHSHLPPTTVSGVPSFKHSAGSSFLSPEDSPLLLASLAIHGDSDFTDFMKHLWVFSFRGLVDGNHNSLGLFMIQPSNHSLWETETLSHS